jgi:hypothetical protein
MDVTFKKPEIEPLFEADIYISKGEGGKEEYRVVIGAYGTAVPPKVGEFLDYHAISAFMNMKDIGKWVNEQVVKLKKEGKKVEFDESLSYLMAGAIEELADESPVEIPISRKPSPVYAYFIMEEGEA